MSSGKLQSIAAASPDPAERESAEEQTAPLALQGVARPIP